MKRETFDAVIIGAGISGLGVGALLARRGKRVLVVERDFFVGGRAASFEYRGYILNRGTHAGFVGGRFDRLMELTGARIPEREIFEDWWIFDFSTHKPVKALSSISLPASSEFLNVSNSVNLAVKSGLAKYDAMSAAEWLYPLVKDPYLREIISWCGIILTCVPRIENLAASSLIEAIKILWKAPVTWLAAKGIGDFCQALAAVVHEHGGQVRVSTNAKKILIEDQQVCG